MCIAAPAKIVEIDTESNICAADFGGVRQNAKLDLLPDVEIGDYVLSWDELLEMLEEEDKEREKMMKDML